MIMVRGGEKHRHHTLLVTFTLVAGYAARMELRCLMYMSSIGRHSASLMWFGPWVNME